MANVDEFHALTKKKMWGVTESHYAVHTNQQQHDVCVRITCLAMRCSMAWARSLNCSCWRALPMSTCNNDVPPVSPPTSCSILVVRGGGAAAPLPAAAPVASRPAPRRSAGRARPAPDTPVLPCDIDSRTTAKATPTTVDATYRSRPALALLPLPPPLPLPLPPPLPARDALLRRRRCRFFCEVVPIDGTPSAATQGRGAARDLAVNGCLVTARNFRGGAVTDS